MTDQVKVSWKAGNVELQYEGSEEFLLKELPKLFQELLDIYKSSSKNGEQEPPEPPHVTESPTSETTDPGKIAWSVNTIATRLGVKEGKELAWAACAYLRLVQGKATFSRAEVRNAMKEATHFYTETHRKSLSDYIQALMKDRCLLERSPQVYAIEDHAVRELESNLGIG
jgi:hypothetical protein